MFIPGGIRAQPQPWTPDEDDRLRLCLETGVPAVPEAFPGRTAKAILRRTERLKAGVPSRTLESSARLFTEIVDFCAAHRLAHTTFGAMAVRSPRLIATLASGRCCGPAMERRIRAFMDQGTPRRRMTLGEYKAYRYRKIKSRNQAKEALDAMFRATDEAERAKLFIRRSGRHCFNAEITRSEHLGKFFIGGRLVTRAELIAFAREKGWEG